METSTKNYEHVYKTIQKSLKEYLDTYGIKNVVLGISGGIDSTVVAAIVHGMKDVHLIGVSMPCSTNKKDEVSAASKVGKEFCDTFIEHDIQDAFSVMEKHCREISGTDSTPISQGNIKARLRMIALYDIASKAQGVVLDTDNKTEHLLGFFTINGDCTDLSPIANLWKTEVYELAEWLNKNVYKDSEALKDSIALIPTDGNGVSNSDLDQIAPGCTYADVDKILKMWTNLHPHVRHIIIDKFDFDMGEKSVISSVVKEYGRDIVKGVCLRNARSKFKRAHRPFIVDIGLERVLDGNNRPFLEIE